MQTADILRDLPCALYNEVTEILAQSDKVKIERIISQGQNSPPGFWYDQEQNEWILLVKGKAILRFETNDELIHLNEGMHLTIPAHARHRVEWTSRNTPAIWLAVFY